jgi:hypothetical protein
MQTVFSYIIQKRFSNEGEDIATDALAYILASSDAARRGMMRLLRGIIPNLPPLQFKTQQVEGEIRPDMWGFADSQPRVFVENKFWAGLTVNQPVTYLKSLAACSEPTILLFIAPAPREQSLWRELIQRLRDEKIAVVPRAVVAGVAECVAAELGPLVALTSWTDVLSILEHEASDDPGARGDLIQLRALCDAADNDAFSPASREQLSDQRTASFIVQLCKIVQAAVALAETQNLMSTTGLRPQASWGMMGRYARIAGHHGVVAWIGIHFGLWKAHGGTPLWLVFYDRGSRGQEVRGLIEPWAAKSHVLATPVDGGFVIALDVQTGEEKDGVVRSLVAQIRAIAQVLDALPPKPLASVDGESNLEPASEGT